MAAELRKRRARVQHSRVFTDHMAAAAVYHLGQQLRVALQIGKRHVASTAKAHLTLLTARAVVKKPMRPIGCRDVEPQPVAIAIFARALERCPDLDRGQFTHTCLCNLPQNP